MSQPSFVVDPSVLRAEAARMDTVAESLAAASSLPSADAGRSTKEVDDLVRRITEEVTGARGAAGALSRSLLQAAATYVATDQANASRFPTSQPGPAPTPPR